LQEENLENTLFFDAEAGKSRKEQKKKLVIKKMLAIFFCCGYNTPVFRMES